MQLIPTRQRLKQVAVRLGAICRKKRRQARALTAGFRAVTTHLVTGAAGFIGSHTCVRLLERGDSVVALDNLNDYYDPKRKRQNLEEVARAAQGRGTLTFVEGDIRDRECLSDVFARHPVEVVVHLAAMAGVRVSVDDPWLYYAVNLTGTLNLLDLVRAQPRAANFVLASTSSVYGDAAALPFVESDAAAHPLAPYPASKRAAEMLGFTYHHLHGLDFTALRFFTVYGPRGRPDMMAYKVLDSAFDGPAVPYYNAGQMHRDWTHVNDIVSGIVAAGDRRLGYEVINLGRGQPVLLDEFVRRLTERLPSPPKLVPKPMPSADVKYTYADISKAQRLLGYAPKVSVEEGIETFYSWYMRSVRGT